MDKFTFKEHFIALKYCLLKVFLSYIFGFIVCYYLSETILHIALKPLLDIIHSNQVIIYTDLTEAFMAYIKIASYASLILIHPFFYYQIYSFISPGLYAQEQKILKIILFSSSLLFLCGSLFLYYIIIPNAWLFLTSFGNNNAIPLILNAKISEYLSLFLNLLFVFATSFQLPVILSILSLLGLVRSEQLRQKRRFIIVIIFIISAIFTPPDIFSQIALAIPLILLYEISIAIGQLIERKVKE
ncbi:MAG: hypothetical protein DGJ47_000817 [Rickettsiaceae bacterium]